MFQATLINLIGKNLLMNQAIVADIIEIIIDKCGNYLKKVLHEKGVLIQMDRTNYDEARKYIISIDVL